MYLLTEWESWTGKYLAWGPYSIVQSNANEFRRNSWFFAWNNILTKFPRIFMTPIVRSKIHQGIEDSFKY